MLTRETMSQDDLESLIAKDQAKLCQNPSETNLAAVESLRQCGWHCDLFTAPIALRLVRLLRQFGNHQCAQEVLTHALTAYPDQAEFFNEQGYLYSDLNRYDQAFDWFRETIKKNPQAANELHLAALVGAGGAQRNLRDFELAAEMFQQALVAAGGTASASLLIEQGWLCFYQKCYADAFARFQEAANQLPEKEKHAARVGLLASRRQLDLLSAIKGDDSARKLVSDWIAAEVLIDEVVNIFVECSGSVLEHLNLYPAALKNAEHLLEVAKDNERGKQQGVYFKIGALKWLRRYAAAEKTFLEASHKLQTDVLIWKERANTFFERKRFLEAYLHYSGKVLDRSDLSEDEKKLKKDLTKDLDAREWTIVSLRKMRRFDEARSEVNNALSVVDKKLNFFSELAALHYAERDYDSAIELFNRALELNDYDTYALQWRAASLRKNGSLPEAKLAIDQALKKAPYAARLWDERGWLAFDQGEFDDAIKAFDKSIELDPYMIHRQFAKVEALLRLNRSDDALLVYTKLEQQFPNDAEIEEQLCWFYIKMGQLELARELQVRLRQCHPNSALGLTTLGGYELARKQYPLAEKAFRDAIAKVDYEPQYYVNLALALIRQVKSSGECSRLEAPKRDQLIDEAKQHCRTALKLDPYNAKAYGCLGVIAFKQETFLDAEFYFRKSIEVNPNEGSYGELGSLYCQMGSYDKATATLQKLLEVKPDDSHAYIELGNVAVWKEDNKEAVTYCRKAVFVEPQNIETHRALAIALMRADQYEEAELVVRKALRSLTPYKPWRLYLLLAQILVRIADTANKDRKKKDFDLYEEALGYVNEARRAHSLNADILFHLGIVQSRLEDFATSQKSFAECLKLNRDRFDAERNNRIVQASIQQQRRLLNINEKFSYGLALIFVVMLAALWIAYFRGHKRPLPAQSPTTVATAASTPVATDEFTVDRSLLNLMTPLLLGLLTIAALLPHLTKLKLPGFEAEIAEPKPPDPNISTGPRGETGFGSSLLIVDQEPR